MPSDKIRAVIIDDEVGATDILEALLKRHSRVDIVAVCNDAESGIESVASHLPDLVFLDIRMPGKDGFQVLDELRKISNLEPEVVFTTAYEDQALRAFDYSAFAYLVKPIDPDKLKEVIDRFQKHHTSLFASRADHLLSTLKKVIFKTQDRGYIFIDPAEIYYCEADGQYCNIHYSLQQKETISINLGTLEEKLRDYPIYRVHRSYLVNLAWLKNIDKNKCTLQKNGESYTCEITRDAARELIQMLQI